MIPGDGILLIDKPAGVTSFDVVDHVRRALVQAYPELAPQRGRGARGGPRPPRFKCGHAGTLDPLATGLLVILVGRGSRLAPFLIGLDKTYAATVRFGAGTDTLDREGEVVVTAPPPGSVEKVTHQLDSFRGDILQVPPVISALKKDGQPLYKLARSGQDVPEPEPRPVVIHSLELVASRWHPPDFEVDLEVSCSSGTYIRSLARDLAQAAGSEGYIQDLRRLTVGPFPVTEALPGVMELTGQDLARGMRPLVSALPHVPAVFLDAAQAASVRQGQQPVASWLDGLEGEIPVAGKAGRLLRLVDEDDSLIAVCRLDETTGEPVLAAVIPADYKSTGQPEGGAVCD